VLPKEKQDWLQQPSNFKQFQKKYKLMERAEQDAVSSKRRQEQEKLKSDYRGLLLQRLKEQEVYFC
jgi:hypothetical protein